MAPLSPLSELAHVGVPETLEGLFALVIHIDRQLRERWLKWSATQAHPEWITPRVPLSPSRQPPGHFEYHIMPFGLCNAPATFPHFMNVIFRDFLDLFVIVYVEDILIFPSTPACHQTHVRQVLLLHGLFARPEKCEFGVSRIKFWDS